VPTVSRPDLGTFTFAYNADGQLNTLTRPNGVTSTNSYDTAGRLAGLTYKNAGGTTIAAYGYTLDAAGNRTSASTDGATEHYTIDPAGRLTGVTYADGTAVTFGYDAAGNRTSMTAGGSTTAYTYDAAGELKSAGSTSYSYDPAGNRLTAGSASYSYDSFGNLASATSGATTIAYKTNGDGLRVSATSGSTTSAYTWDEAAGLPALLSDGTNGYLSADTTLLAETSASAAAYPLTDALGSVRAQTDSTGSLTASASYGTYGDVRSASRSLGSLGYTGALTDSSGLVYLQARSLDTASGTFTSRDPMTPGGPGVTGFNPYAYAGQNPTTLTDPSGRFAFETAETDSTVVAAAAPTAAGMGYAINAALDAFAIRALLSCSYHLVGRVRSATARSTFPGIRMHLIRALGVRR
jgi:RHS repeat-associated protein